jgi:hypothetical protein
MAMFPCWVRVDPTCVNHAGVATDEPIHFHDTPHTTPP